MERRGTDVECRNIKRVALKVIELYKCVQIFVCVCVYICQRTNLIIFLKKKNDIVFQISGRQVLIDI